MVEDFVNAKHAKEALKRVSKGFSSSASMFDTSYAYKCSWHKNERDSGVTLYNVKDHWLLYCLNLILAHRNIFFNDVNELLI